MLIFTMHNGITEVAARHFGGYRGNMETQLERARMSFKIEGHAF